MRRTDSSCRFSTSEKTGLRSEVDWARAAGSSAAPAAAVRKARRSIVELAASDILKAPLEVQTETEFHLARVDGGHAAGRASNAGQRTDRRLIGNHAPGLRAIDVQSRILRLEMI